VIPLPAALGGAGLFGWRLDKNMHASTWDSGLGAERNGGRWNSRGTRVVYASLDPSTAVLEVAVHVTFRTLDKVAHKLTSFEVTDPSLVHVVRPEDVPNPRWLLPGIPSAGQREFGDHLISTHAFIVIPSAVSRHSWNLIFNPELAAGKFAWRLQEQFVLDARLHPAA